MRFLLEASQTPIYNRIVNAFAQALQQTMYDVVIINPASYKNIDEYLEAINNSSVDYCVITNSVSPLSTPAPDKQFFFELLQPRLIFIHHDRITGHFSGEMITERLSSFLRTRDKSWHFCLEYNNYLDLREAGIRNAFPIYHASEFTYENPPSQYSFDVSFLGHVLPGVENLFGNAPFPPTMQADFWNRIVRLDTCIEPSAVAFANTRCSSSGCLTEWLAAKHSYISGIHCGSQLHRGEVIKRLGLYNIDIIGGDPAYLHGKTRSLKIEKRGLRYHPPLQHYTNASDVYALSKINLNITSLQFDNAVINRVIDIGAVGGFVLTDSKSDLRKITTVHNEISYRTIDELNGKIEYFLGHESERRDIAKQFEQDIRENCTYQKIWEYIMSKLNDGQRETGGPVRLDVGCGPRKKEGYIGVDFDANWPGIDVAADLTKRFPYPDNSVDEIRAHDIIEHLPDRIHTMNEFWRICKHGAKLDIRVPSTDGRGAFQDPTHVSFWNVNSFKYYCNDFPAYLELCRSYGFRGSFKIERISQEQSPDGVIHVNALLTVLK